MLPQIAGMGYRRCFRIDWLHRQRRWFHPELSGDSTALAVGERILANVTESMGESLSLARLSRWRSPTSSPAEPRRSLAATPYPFHLFHANVAQRLAPGDSG